MAPSKPPSMAGVGLVLDTRQKDAKAAVRAIEREMSEVQGQVDKAGGQVSTQTLVNRIPGPKSNANIR